MSARPRFPAGGFGYALNYDKEIANDEAEIAAYERALAHDYTKPNSMQVEGYYYPIWQLAFESRAIAKSIGLSGRDVGALADYIEMSEAQIVAFGHWHNALEVPETGRAWHERGKAALAKCTEAWPYDDLLSVAQLKRARSKAKAALARHMRNREKYGKAVQS